MFKCPACKKPTISWKQKFSAAWGRKIKCTNCGSSLGIGYPILTFVMVGLMMWLKEAIFHFKNKIFNYLLPFIIVTIVYYVLRIFIFRLSVWYNNDGLKIHEQQERMTGKRL